MVNDMAAKQNLNPDLATVIPLILTSDKTHLSGSRKVKAWPLFLTIGNISSAVRFVPNNCASRLIALLPLLDGTIATQPE
jgi:hypothetical protein